MEDYNQFNFYQYYFNEFDKYLMKINADNFSNIHIGYLINLLKFNEFKNTAINNYSNEMNIILSPENIDSKNLYYRLSNGEKFIIINSSLSEAICTQNINNITYKINSQEITLFTKDNKELKFHNFKNNVLGKKLLI